MAKKKNGQRLTRMQNGLSSEIIIEEDHGNTDPQISAVTTEPDVLALSASALNSTPSLRDTSEPNSQPSGSILSSRMRRRSTNDDLAVVTDTTAAKSSSDTKSDGTSMALQQPQPPQEKQPQELQPTNIPPYNPPTTMTHMVPYTFPFLLHQFLNEVAVQYNNSIVRWNEDGVGFAIERKHKLLPALLKKYFGHDKYESLRRQLNIYGFRFNNGNFEHKGSNPFLRTSSQEDLIKIKPRPKKSRIIRKQQKLDRMAAFTTSTEGSQVSSPYNSIIGNEYDNDNEKKNIFKNQQTDSEVEALNKNDDNTLANLHSTSSKFTTLPRTPAFVTVLYQFLMDFTANRPDVVRWSDGGDGFFINRDAVDSNSVLDSYFKHQNFDSLRRQLNGYGFRKHSDGSFRHKLFHRDKPENCDVINRRYRDKREALKKQRKTRKTEEKNIFLIASEQKKINLSQIEPTNEQIAAVAGDIELGYSNDSSGSSIDFTESSDCYTIEDYDDSLSTYKSLDFDASTTCSVDLADDDYEEINVDVDTTEPPYPPPSFHVFERVYAADKDGMLYAAVIRRHLFGPQYHHQVEMGIVSSQEEADIILMGRQPVPMWHYFVHYNKWNVNFDRWVPEYYVYKKTSEVVEFADRLLNEYRALKKELRHGKKKIDGVKFMVEWKTRMVAVSKELNFDHKFLQMHRIDSSHSIDLKEEEEYISEGDTSENNATTANKSTNDHIEKRPKTVWTKAALLIEKNLREKGLSTKRKIDVANVIPLPFALKKTMVESWEIISQCKMLPTLPAPVSIRTALDLYVKSKDVQTRPLNPEEHHANTSIASGRKRPPCPVEGTKGPDVATSNTRKKEWLDMADGIAKLFDQALPEHLLYREEVPQLRMIETMSAFQSKRFSEIFGCEHLLRLFIRLPDILDDQLDTTNRNILPSNILAKVNDFVRFLNKNQGTLFVQSHRKLSDSELEEQAKLLADTGKATRRKLTTTCNANKIVATRDDEKQPQSKKTRKK